MMKYYLTCIFLSGGFLTSSAFGGTSFSKADSLALEGKYYPASVEYERTAFLSTSNRMRTISLIRKAECLKQIGNYSEAENTAERIIYSDLSDTLIAESRYQNALCSYLAGDFSNAENNLLQMHSFIKDTSLTNYSLPLYALVLNELQRWNEAKEKILKSIDISFVNHSKKDSLRKVAELLYAPKNFPHLKKLLKAQKMSTFLPGLGQLYAGYFWEGAASSFLNLASVGLIGYFIYVRVYFTALTAGSSVFSKFYIGGSNRLEYLVEKRNYSVLRSYNNKLKLFIVNSSSIK